MWIPESLPLLLKELRKSRSLSQHEAARRAGLTQARVSDFEAGRRPPSRGALEALCPVLGVSVDEVVRRTAWMEPRVGRPGTGSDAALLDRFAPDTFYIPPRERDFAYRMGAVRARFAAVYAWLEPRLDARPDRVQVQNFARDLPVASAEEAVFDLHTLALPASLHRVAPVRLGFHVHPVVDSITREYLGCRRRATLGFQVGRAQLAMVPQVGVRPNGRPFTLDRLAGVCGVGEPYWCVVEVDGTGHEDAYDRDRRLLVGLPELRVTTEMLHDRAFGPRMVRTLLVMAEERTVGVVRQLVPEPGRARG